MIFGNLDISIKSEPDRYIEDTFVIFYEHNEDIGTQLILTIPVSKFVNLLKEKGYKIP